MLGRCNAVDCPYPAPCSFTTCPSVFVPVELCTVFKGIIVAADIGCWKFALGGSFARGAVTACCCIAFGCVIILVAFADGGGDGFENTEAATFTD